MRLLLDSHAYLWWLADDRRLSRAAARAVADPRAAVHVSAASIWEIAIKAQLGRLDLGGLDIVSAIAENEFQELAVSALHAQRGASLPRHHDDPFDRLLVAQAQSEALTLVTRDEVFEAYAVSTRW